MPLELDDQTRAEALQLITDMIDLVDEIKTSIHHLRAHLPADA